MNLRAATLALALHAAALLPFLPIPGCIEPKLGNGAGQAQGREDPPPVLARIIPGGGVQCPRPYRGIGVLTSAFGTVLEVVEHGPAWVAGIRVDDVIANAHEMWPDRYPLGHLIRVECSREGREFIALVRVGEVCST